MFLFTLIAFLTITYTNCIAYVREDELCYVDGEKEWRCKAVENCGNNMSRNNLSIPCEDGTVCCSHNRLTRQMIGSKANAYCEAQLKLCKPLNVGESDLGSIKEGDEYDIVNRERYVDTKEHPYMALIAYGSGLGGKKWSCGGTLISDQFVLTTAKCAFHPEYGPARWVSIGSGAEKVELGVTRRFVHPLYADDSVLYDAALLRLPSPVDVNDSIRPACLSTMSWVPYENVLAIGWTTPKQERLFRNSDPLLVEALLQTKTTSSCESSQRSLARLSSTEPLLCAGEGGNEICRGIPGVSLVVRKGNRCLRTILGITTANCTLPIVPSLFIRISHILQWMEEIVWP